MCFTKKNYGIIQVLLSNLLVIVSVNSQTRKKRGTWEDDKIVMKMYKWFEIESGGRIDEEGALYSFKKLLGILT